MSKKRKNRFKKNKAKIAKTASQNEKPNNTNVKNESTIVNVEDENKKVTDESEIPEELAEKYPILKNQELVNKFLGVTMTNNQKGRVRQQLRDNLKGTSEEILPEVIHAKIKGIVKDIIKLTDAELRKIRILYNMLKTSIKSGTKVQKKTKNKKNKKSKDKVKAEGEKKVEIGATDKDKVNVIDKDANNEDVKVEVNKEKDTKKKTKGPKRYIVFVGNLPLDIDKEDLCHHFYEIREHIVDVRIQKPGEGKKTCIAYVELRNEPSYELALSKHHSMMKNRRINVLYTTQQNSKITKTEAKSKSAKLIALQKSGKLMGSVPLNRKRSQRRMKAKKARAKQEAES
ncbi:unnamed protein product [Euphydryas editha]|uniref:RRM domain-containing protein n=1 Tax=Euphydryas editha TaxID=104508 RepID=A0AAU9TFB6_EUPED|nr:unnamed protein product [Euphydryas editha]